MGHAQDFFQLLLAFGPKSLAVGLGIEGFKVGEGPFSKLWTELHRA